MMKNMEMHKLEMNVFNSLISFIRCREQKKNLNKKKKKLTQASNRK